jgi:hypothetical protein
MNEMFTDLPTVTSAALADIICAVQTSSNTSVQMTLQQVITLAQANTILNYAGDPNGNLAGTTYQLCWDTVDEILYICTTTGTSSTAVWTGATVSYPLDLNLGGTGKSLTASNGGIVYSDANSFEILAPTNVTGRMFQSGNLSAPSWSTPTYPSSSGTAGKVLASDGTNIVYSSSAFPATVGATGTIIISNGTDWVSSTPAYPNLAGTAGKLVISNGTNFVISTPTYPNASVTAGKVIISDGTNYVASTVTWPTTTTINQILYSSSANTVSGISTANNGTLVTSNTGVPSILAGPGTSGNILQSNSGAAPSWSVPTYPSVSGTSGQLLASNGTNVIYSTASFPVTASASGSVIISNGSNWIASTSLFPNTVGTSGTIFRSNGTSNAYSTSTFADTYAASSILYSNGSNAVTGLATANSATLVTNSSGVPGWTASMTNGQVLIGSTGATPVPATIQAGVGVSVGIGAGSITISSTGGGVGWNLVSGTSQAMAVDSGYVANNAGLVTLTLPSTAAFGTSISVSGLGAGGWTIAQNGGQNIQIGSSSTTVGAGGSVSSTNRYDSVNLLCVVANTTWVAIGGPEGNLTIV